MTLFPSLCRARRIASFVPSSKELRRIARWFVHWEDLDATDIAEVESADKGTDTGGRLPSDNDKSARYVASLRRLRSVGGL